MNYKEELGISFPCLEVSTNLSDAERLKEILEDFVIMQYRESNNGLADDKTVNRVHFLVETPDPSKADDDIKAMARKTNLAIETRFLKEGDTF
jgi:hypothetical protein